MSLAGEKVIRGLEEAITMQQNNEPTVDSIISKYISLRTKKQNMDIEHKAKVKTIDERLKKLEAWLQMKMHVDGVKAINTDSGMAYKTTVEQATVSDMNSFIEFVKEKEAWHLLEKRVSKTGIRELLDADEPLPPGINWFVTTAINVRKPNER